MPSVPLWTRDPRCVAITARLRANPPEAALSVRRLAGFDIYEHPGPDARALRQVWRAMRREAFDPAASNGGDAWAEMIRETPFDVIEAIRAPFVAVDGEAQMGEAA